MSPKIGIVILNWNNWEDTLNCLSQIRKLSYPQDRLMIIVVDNGSTDDSVTYLEKIDEITFIASSENKGFAAGSNSGIRTALENDAELILLLNNDTILTTNFLDPLVKTFQDQPNTGIASPKINYAEPNTKKIWFAGGLFKKPRILGSIMGLDEEDRGQWDTPRMIDFAVGCCMLIRKEVFDSIGLLDERFFFYHEDEDFCLRAIKQGFSIWYEPKSIIYHEVAQSTKHDIPRRVYLFNQARVIFLTKNIHGWAIPWVLFLEIIRFFRTLLGYFITKQPDCARSYIGAIIDGLRKSYSIFASDNSNKPGSEEGKKKDVSLWRKIFRFLGPIFFVGVLAYLSIRAYTGFKEIQQSGIHFRPEYLLLSLICQLIGVGIATLVWSNILHKIGVKSDYWFDLEAFCVSNLTRKIPGFIVYALSRIIIYDSIQASKAKVTIAMVIEMVMMSLAGLVVLALTGGSTILAGLGINNVWLLSVLFISIVAITVFFSPRIIQFFLRVTDRNQESTLDNNISSLKKIDTIRWISGEIIMIILAAGVIYFSIMAVLGEASVPYIYVLTAFSITVAVGPLAVWLPGDIGLRDAVNYLAIRPWVGEAFAALLALIYRIWISIIEILIGMVALIFLYRRIKYNKMNESK